MKTIFYISSIFYVLGFFAQSWYGVIAPLKEHLPYVWVILKMVQKVIVTTRNGLFEGFFFMSIGMLFAFIKIEIGMKKAIFGFVISYLLLFIEVFC